MKLFIADVDGVFTNEKAEPNEAAIKLSAQVGAVHPFAYVTGRSATWLTKNLVPILEQTYKNYPPILSLLCAEYGGVQLSFLMGQWHKKVVMSSLSERHDEIAQQLSKIPGIFFDDTKEIMVSVEAQHSLRDSNPGVVEQGLAAAGAYLEQLARQEEGLEYHETTYARDLTPAGLSKAYGARVVLQAVERMPGQVYLLGDSPSDLLLVDPIKSNSLPYTFYYVGDPAQLTPEKINLEFSAARYAEGTIEILTNFLHQN